MNLSEIAVVHPSVQLSVRIFRGPMDSATQPSKKFSLDLAKCSFFLTTLWFGLLPSFLLVMICQSPGSPFVFQPSLKVLCFAIKVECGRDCTFVLSKDDLCVPLACIQGTVWLKNYKWCLKRYNWCKTWINSKLIDRKKKRQEREVITMERNIVSCF